MYLPSLPSIASDLSASASQTQLTLSVFLFGFAVGQFFYGPISDRVGRKPMLLTGLVLFTLASLGCALAPGIESLIGARFFQALGASGPIVLARAIVRDLYEGSRAGRELSRMASIMGVVPAIAPVIGGFLTPFGGWRVTFFLALACGVALTVTVAFQLGESLPRKAAERGLVRVDPAGIPQPPRASGLSGLHDAVDAGLWGPVRVHFRLVFRAAEHLRARAARLRILVRVRGGGLYRRHVRGPALGEQARPRRHDSASASRASRSAAAHDRAGGVGVTSYMAIVGPMAVYCAGVGLTMPQAMASALMPFPDRAGAASSLLGICQMSFAALLGIALGQHLDGSALPLPIAVAATGVTALAVFLSTSRARGAKA